MSTEDERTRRRDERERKTIASLAMIAPTPAMIREVMALVDAAATDMSTGPGSAVIDLKPDREPTTADR